ncbi:Bug family tripartite tricarboxylate transporter substrate binding protein [Halomonas sp. 86]|uniref:Bug family tripartite tricarboxylate transporter substrate binding protein n=1 Tax=unclassified Halomonas TaxID=2609666 RepID=UPI00403391A7
MIIKLTATTLIGATLAAVPVLSQAADYPTRPVSVIVPFNAGGSTDLLGRAFSREMEDILGTAFPVKNIGGGAATIGTANVARARPDGYTIGYVAAAPLISQPHMRDTPYSTNDFTYICKTFDSPQVLATKPDSPFEGLGDLVAYASEHPGELTYSSPGPGSLPHLAMEMLLAETGIEIRHVPMNGDAAGAAALMGGHIDLMMAVIPIALQNELHTIAVMSDERSDMMPDVETSIEQGFDTTFSWWGGVVAPKGVSDDIAATLGDACANATQQERYLEVLSRLGAQAGYLDSEDMAEEVQTQSEATALIIDNITTE